MLGQLLKYIPLEIVDAAAREFGGADPWASKVAGTANAAAKMITVFMVAGRSADVYGAGLKIPLRAIFRLPLVSSE